MKPFAIAFLKCTSCPSTEDLILDAKEVKKIEVDENLEFMKNKKHLFTENNGKLLKMLINNIKNGYVYEHDNDSSMYKFLFGNEIVTGFLICNGCGILYPINDGIVDFLSGIRPENKVSL
ncbi:hypothetical protein DMUE_4058 [Dictyocoela muelleri]|nr:hypothetical protein DMUE_4058 [Dictyocoela muelleri]